MTVNRCSPSPVVAVSLTLTEACSGIQAGTMLNLPRSR